MPLHRRRFLQAGATVGLAELMGPGAWAELQGSMEKPSGPLPRRPLGKTGEELSVIGFGAIVVMGGDQKDANNRVSEAIDRGVNYFDVAPTYGKGEAQEKLGPALEPYRKNVFLACKTQKRDKAGAAEELRASLKEMRTDHFDLYQMHAIRDVEKDVERALAPGGAIEAFIEARDKGLVRFLGFSAHSVDAALRAIESGVFDTILYPTNFVCHYNGNFDQEPIAAAHEKGMGILALKSMARTDWAPGLKREDRPVAKTWYEPLTDPAEAALALRWTLSQPGLTAAIPPGNEDLYRIALNVASVDRPLSRQEESALRQLAVGVTPIFPKAPARPRVGKAAPNVTFPALGKKLSDFRGKKNVVLAFYPKAFTGGCTKQLCGYRDDYAKFRDANTEVIAISLDEQAESDRFKAHHEMPFAVIGDSNKAIAKAFAVPLKTNKSGGQVAQRSIFVINKKGVVTHIDLEYSISNDLAGLYGQMDALAK